MITVCTPTYNRAATLTRLYDSLLAQHHAEIEWLLIDDGSSDDTREVIERCAERAPFPIRYHYQDNGGRHRALNAGFQLAAGEYFMIMDSDDWLAPDAFQYLLAAWKTEAAATCAAVVGLCADHHGSLIGSQFPNDLLLADFESIGSQWGVVGDKKELFRTEVIRNYPFPEFPGEKRVPTSLILIRIAKDFPALYLNRIVCFKEYRPDGLTANLRRIRANSPRGSALRYAEYLRLYPAAPFKRRLRAAANYWRYRLHGAPERADIKLPLQIAGGIIGGGLYAVDKYRLRRRVEAGNRTRTSVKTGLGQ
jgi:glycosyltransferase involved in cell wall biosynthesis